MAINFSAGSTFQNVTFSIQPKSTTIVVNVGGNILNHAFLRDDGRLCGPTKSLTEESLMLIPKHPHEIDIGLRIINQFPILYFVVFINASRI